MNEMIKEFSCYLDEAQTKKAFGTVQQMGPSYMSADPVYIVDCIINESRYKFTLFRKNKVWAVNVLSVLSVVGKLKSIDSFAIENKTVDGAFQEALCALVNYKNHAVQQFAVSAPQHHTPPDQDTLH